MDHGFSNEVEKYLLVCVQIVVVLFTGWRSIAIQCFQIGWLSHGKVALLLLKVALLAFLSLSKAKNQQTFCLSDVYMTDGSFYDTGPRCMLTPMNVCMYVFKNTEIFFLEYVNGSFRIHKLHFWQHFNTLIM